MTSVIGWDIGGANLKAARAENGTIVKAIQLICTPHHGLSCLEQAIEEAAAQLGPADRHGVTMTAELSDAFETRALGVVSVAAICANKIGSAEISFYAGARGFVGRADVVKASCAIASANWRASATLVARQCADALMIDMGSTTTDLIPICAGSVASLGATDAERLSCGELVYTGFSRGNPLAGLSSAPIDGRWTQLVNENFAIMADVRRVLDDLPEAADLMPTADGRGKTIEASMARLARLVGRDATDASPQQWRDFADYLARAQLRLIEDQIALLKSRGAFAPEAAFVGAGVGRNIVERLAHAEQRAYHDFDAFVDATPEAKTAAGDCAPAAAIALLLGAEREK
jgi:probable H4MPT-linked C1 transfer pathway protein